MSETQRAKIKWHPYPEVPVPKTKQAKAYLVTGITSMTKRTIVRVAYSQGSFDDYRGAYEVIAWAELPEPYKKPEPLDMHPDAVYAREFMENERRRRLNQYR